MDYDIYYRKYKKYKELYTALRRTQSSPPKDGVLIEPPEAEPKYEPDNEIPFENLVEGNTYVLCDCYSVDTFSYDLATVISIDKSKREVKVRAKRYPRNEFYQAGFTSEFCKLYSMDEKKPHKCNNYPLGKPYNHPSRQSYTLIFA